VRLAVWAHCLLGLHPGVQDFRLLLLVLAVQVLQVQRLPARARRSVLPLRCRYSQPAARRGAALPVHRRHHHRSRHEGRRQPATAQKRLQQVPPPWIWPSQWPPPAPTHWPNRHPLPGPLHLAPTARSGRPTR
jgi:hypothetical protein